MLLLPVLTLTVLPAMALITLSSCTFEMASAITSRSIHVFLASNLILPPLAYRELNGIALDGTLPSDISALSSLTVLYVTTNFVTKFFPSGFRLLCFSTELTSSSSLVVAKTIKGIW